MVPPWLRPAIPPKNKIFKSLLSGEVEVDCKEDLLIHLLTNPVAMFSPTIPEITLFLSAF